MTHNKDNTISSLLDEIKRGKAKIDETRILSKHLNEQMRLDEDEDESEGSEESEGEEAPELTGLEEVPVEGGEEGDADDMAGEEPVTDMPDAAMDEPTGMPDADFSDETEVSTDVDSLAGYTPDEDGNYHLTLTKDEINNLLPKLPADAQIVMVRKDTFDVSVTTNDMSSGMSNDMPDGDMGGDEMEDDTTMDMDMEDTDGDELDDTSADTSMLKNEGKDMKTLKQRNKLYEKQILQLRKKIKLQESQITAGEARLNEFKDALVEGKKHIIDLRTVNENLQNVMYLFSSYNLTGNEKKLVLESFNNAKSVDSSKLLLEVYRNQFESLEKTPFPNKKEVLQKAIINEAKDKAPKKVVKSQFFKYL